MTEKLSINGLKLSEPLALIQVHAPHATFGLLSPFCRLLAQHQVNITFITTSAAIDSQPVVCCIEAKDQSVVEALTEQHERLRGYVHFCGRVGVVTFYPHHANFKFMGLALQVFSRNGIKVHALASSISALSFVVDFDRLEEAGRLLVESFQLPENASPLRTDFKVRQERRPI